MNPFLLIILFSISGCANNKYLFKAALIKKSPLELSSFAPQKPIKAKQDILKNCRKTSPFSKNENFISKDEMYKRICANSDYIYNVEYSRESVLLHPEICFVLKAECGE